MFLKHTTMNGGQSKAKEKERWGYKLIGIFEKYINLSPPLTMKSGCSVVWSMLD